MVNDCVGCTAGSACVWSDSTPSRVMCVAFPSAVFACDTSVRIAILLELATRSKVLFSLGSRVEAQQSADGGVAPRVVVGERPRREPSRVWAEPGHVILDTDITWWSRAERTAAVLIQYGFPIFQDRGMERVPAPRPGVST